MIVRATSLKMPAILKARVEAVAQATGTSTHAFMVAAIESETSRAEKYAEFLDEARQADQEFERTGLYYASEDLFRYLDARAVGNAARRPRARTWRR